MKTLAACLLIIVSAMLFGACAMDVKVSPDSWFISDARARVEAQSRVQLAVVEAQAKVETTRMWAGLLLVLIVGLLVLAGIVLYFRGQAHLRMVERSDSLLPGQRGFEIALGQVARERKAEMEVREGRYYLVKGEQRQEVRKLLPVE